MDSVLVVNTITGALTDAVAAFVGFLPTLVTALLIVGLGSAIAIGIGRFTTQIANYANLDARAADTPLAAIFNGRPRVALIAGTVVKVYGVLLALRMAAGYLGLTGLNTWLAQVVGYLPQVIGGLAIIGGGMMAASYAGTAAERSMSGMVGAIVTPILKGVLYFMVVVVGVDTMGINVQIVYVVGETLSTALGLGLALALGLALGLGGQEYVAEHIGEWADGSGSAGGGSAGGSAGASTSGASDDWDDTGSTDDGMDDSWDDGGMDDSGMDDDGIDDDWDDGGDWDDDAGDDWDDDGVEDLSEDWEEDF